MTDSNLVLKLLPKSRFRYNHREEGGTDFHARPAPLPPLQSTYMFMPLGSGEDDSQDADELEDGTQEQPIAE